VIRLQTNLFRPQSNLFRPQSNLFRLQTNLFRPESNVIRPETCKIRPETCKIRHETCKIRPESNVIRHETCKFRPESDRIGGDFATTTVSAFARQYDWVKRACEKFCDYHSVGIRRSNLIYGAEGPQGRQSIATCVSAWKDAPRIDERQRRGTSTRVSALRAFYILSHSPHRLHSPHRPHGRCYYLAALRALNTYTGASQPHYGYALLPCGPVGLKH
jgi:hypothetical protein